jgi:hypothetical protein
MQIEIIKKLKKYQFNYDRKYGVSKNNSIKMIKSIMESYFNLLK